MPQETMDTRIKNWVGSAVVIALIAGAISVLWYAYTYSRATEPSSFRNFSVSGEGKAVAIPDVATFTFEVITEGGKNLADSQTTNTQRTNGALSFIKSKGVADKDIRTQSYNVEPRYQSFNCVPVYYQC